MGTDDVRAASIRARRWAYGVLGVCLGVALGLVLWQAPDRTGNLTERPVAISDGATGDSNGDAALRAAFIADRQAEAGPEYWAERLKSGRVRAKTPSQRFEL